MPARAFQVVPGAAPPTHDARNSVMLVFVAKRILQSLPILFLSTVLIFLLLKRIPGDPAVIFAGPDASPEVVASVRQSMGLDRPLLVQYGLWLGRVARGDLGTSYFSRMSTVALISRRLPATLELAIAGLVLALAVALPLGTLAALRPGSLIDTLVSVGTATAVAIPNFWFGILAILLFSLLLGWLPPGGRIEFSHDPWLFAQSLILPAVTLALTQTAILTRFVRAALDDVMGEMYIRTARSKGLRERTVVLRHALRNAMVPVTTVLGIQLGRLLGGAVVIEMVFSWPGIGQLLVQAVGNRDYLVVQGLLLLLATAFVFVNLVTDLVYGVLDPRIQLAEHGVQ